jgi:hypothetical protein
MVAQLLELVRLMSRPSFLPCWRVIAQFWWRSFWQPACRSPGASPQIFDLDDAYISLHSAPTCAISIAVAVPFLAWVRVDTGAWIPQTMHAKAAWFAEACNPWPTKLSVATEAIRRLFGPDQLLVFIVAIIPLVRTRLGRIGLLSC